MMRVRVHLDSRAYDIAVWHEATAGDFGNFAATCLDAAWPGAARTALIIADEITASIAEPYRAAMSWAGTPPGTRTQDPLIKSQVL